MVPRKRKKKGIGGVRASWKSGSKLGRKILVLAKDQRVPQAGRIAWRKDLRIAAGKREGRILSPTGPGKGKGRRRRNIIRVNED